MFTNSRKRVTGSLHPGHIWGAHGKRCIFKTTRHTYHTQPCVSMSTTIQADNAHRDFFPRWKPVISDKQSNPLCHIATNADPVNYGLTTSGIEDRMQTIKPDLLLKQVQNYLSRTFKTKSKNRLKPNSVKVQNTVSRRSQCILVQQFRWYKTMDTTLDSVRNNNNRVCNKMGLLFGEVINHFRIRANKAYL